MRRERVYHFPKPRNAFPAYRRDVSWRRRWHRKDEPGRPHMSTGALLASAVFAYLRRGAQILETDVATYQELQHRSWRFYEVDQRRNIRIPAWLTMDVADRRYWWFLAVLVEAYRAGAVGLMVSYEEASALCGVSRRTWARWIVRMQEAELLRVMPTRPRAQGGRKNRDKGMNMYQAGDALLRAGGYEGCLEDLGEGRTRWVRKSLAKAARKLARRFRRQQTHRLYLRQRAGVVESLPISTPPEETAHQRGDAEPPTFPLSSPKSQTPEQPPAPVPSSPNCSATLAPHTSVTDRGEGTLKRRGGRSGAPPPPGKNERRDAASLSFQHPPAGDPAQQPDTQSRAATTGGTAIAASPMPLGGSRGGRSVRADASDAIKRAIDRVTDGDLAALLQRHVLGVAT